MPTTNVSPSAYGKYDFDGVSTYTKTTGSGITTGFDTATISRAFLLFTIPLNLTTLISGAAATARLKIQAGVTSTNPSGSSNGIKGFFLNSTIVGYINGSSNPQDVYVDLGKGGAFAVDTELSGLRIINEHLVPESTSSGATLTFELNADGVDQINIAIGGTLGIGLAMSSPQDGYDGSFAPIVVFSSSGLSPFHLEIDSTGTPPAGAGDVFSAEKTPVCDLSQPAMRTMWIPF